MDQSWRQKFASVLDWSPVDKGILLPAILLMIIPIYVASCFYGLAHPHSEKLVQAENILLLIQLLFALLLICAVLIGWGFLLRRRQPNALWYQYLTIQFYAISLVVLGYTVGLNSVATGVVLLGAPIFGFIVMDRQGVWFGTFSALVLFLGLSFGTALGILPYAPALMQPTDVESALYATVSTIIYAAPHFIVLILLADQAVHYWRRREGVIRELSLTDSLTSLPNRRHIMDMLNKEVARTSRHGPPLCVVIVDLDHFKKINDTWGHPVGDEVLRSAAKTLKSCIRQTDFIGRYGGEEFMIVLPDTTADGARIFMERCRSVLASQPINAGKGNLLKITGSFGVVCNQHDVSTDVEKLIKAADEALYNAKANGRNRIEISAFPYAKA